MIKYLNIYLNLVNLRLALFLISIYNLFYFNKYNFIMINDEYVHINK